MLTQTKRKVPHQGHSIVETRYAFDLGGGVYGLDVLLFRTYSERIQIGNDTDCLDFCDMRTGYKVIRDWHYKVIADFA